ncbi:NmrA family NAD(P)-binding protein [Streptomyces sp. NPDC007100]|uniref:NmrA family NAD(P)-binding protein n=1 Tax=Streptomyces sp. NPDC007100 TaxID=3155602 RepID=UPI0033CC009E
MLAVAVTGATGVQGGATARALLAAGHHVRALIRHPGSPAADALRDLGADVRHADFDDRASLGAALCGADSLFAVTTPFGTDTTTETRQGKVLVDAAAAARSGTSSSPPPRTPTVAPRSRTTRASTWSSSTSTQPACPGP